MEAGIAGLQVQVKSCVSHVDCPIFAERRYLKLLKVLSFLLCLKFNSRDCDKIVHKNLHNSIFDGSPNVLFDGTSEENRFLTNHGYMVPEMPHVDCFEVMAAGLYRALVGIVHPLQQL